MKVEHFRSYGKRSKKSGNTILWEFLGGNAVSSYARVSLGEKDPLTGAVLDDPEIFEEYRRCDNRKIDQQAAYRFPKPEGRRKAAEEKKKAQAEIERQFVQSYGYKPCADTVSYLLEQQYPSNSLISLDDELTSLSLQDVSVESAFSDTAGDDVQSLREYVSTLTPLQHDIYSAMLLKYDGGGLWITDAELAEKWGVHPTSILYERKKIIAGIRRAVAEGRR